MMHGERPNHVGYSQVAAAEGPLTRDEVVALSREIGERREAWRDACDAHLWDCIWHTRTGSGIDDVQTIQMAA